MENIRARDRKPPEDFIVILDVSHLPMWLIQVVSFSKTIPLVKSIISSRQRNMLLSKMTFKMTWSLFEQMLKINWTGIIIQATFANTEVFSIYVRYLFSKFMIFYWLLLVNKNVKNGCQIKFQNFKNGEFIECGLCIQNPWLLRFLLARTQLLPKSSRRGWQLHITVKTSFTYRHLQNTERMTRRIQT